ncbi:MAG: peroxiredoxin [Chloroflexota bacterium]|nr:peroxiredoxin [Chloroflexota bacterium]
MIDIGVQAPQFTLPNQDGNEVSLSDYSGKWLVLYFYPKDDTSGCTKEACDFTDELDNFASLNASVLGVSKDDMKSHKKFIHKYGLGIDLLSDTEKTVHKDYGAWGIKKQYGKEYEGTIRSTFIVSPEGKVAMLWRNVRVRSKRKGEEITHASIVQVKLMELQGLDT